jgi:hypothetical protein
MPKVDFGIKLGGDIEKIKRHIKKYRSNKKPRQLIDTFIKAFTERFKKSTYGKLPPAYTDYKKSFVEKSVILPTRKDKYMRGIFIESVGQRMIEDRKYVAYFFLPAGNITFERDDYLILKSPWIRDYLPQKTANTRLVSVPIREDEYKKLKEYFDKEIDTIRRELSRYGIPLVKAGEQESEVDYALLGLRLEFGFEKDHIPHFRPFFLSLKRILKDMMKKEKILKIVWDDKYDGKRQRFPRAKIRLSELEKIASWKDMLSKRQTFDKQEFKITL